jgi:hypothetical protein
LAEGITSYGAGMGVFCRLGGLGGFSPPKLGTLGITDHHALFAFCGHYAAVNTRPRLKSA